MYGSMTPRPDHLPDYRRPPLNEVALGVQFSEVRGLASIHAGLFWDEIRDRFPKWSEQPPLPITFEVFGGAELRGSPAPMVEMLTVAPMNRFWFINESEVELIQLQRDRFHHNWRNVGQATKYPHYEAIQEAFRDELGHLSKFLEKEKLGPIDINQCELTYVNHFEVGQEESFPAAMSRLFGHWQNFGDILKTDLEDVTTTARFLLEKPGSKASVGRVHVAIQSRYMNDGRPIILMQLTARGRPLQAGLDGCFDFMSLAREAIVFKFTQLTSDEMHKRWERFR